VKLGRLHLLLLLVVMGGVFAYGFVAGAYQLFPFYQVAQLKNVLTGDTGEGTAIYVPATPQSVTIQEGGLQRLLLKRIQLPNANLEFRAGGAISSAGNVLYVFTRDGALLAFDMANIAPLETAIPAAPINRRDLMLSRFRYQIPLGWFRVKGAYVEETGPGANTIYVSHTVLDVQRQCFTYNISRIRVVHRDGRVEPAPGEDGWDTIFTTDPCMLPQGEEGYGRHTWSGHISGGKIIPFDDRRLLISVGDYNFDGYLREAWSMDPSNLYGKYVLLDRETGAAEIYADGARNVMGLHRDGEGTIWATESGPQGGDELNIVEEGVNYGWPLESYGINYENNPWEPAAVQGRHDTYHRPVFAWVPSVVPTNIVRLGGERFPLLEGDLIMGTLRGQALHRLRVEEGNRIVYEEVIPMGDRIRDVTLLSDGRLAVLTDDTGLLILIDNGGAVYEPLDEVIRARMAALEAYDAIQDADALERSLSLTGDQLFEQKCSSCHVLEERNLTGPSLGGLFGRRIGGLQGFGYSYDLSIERRSWTPEALRSFLLTPGVEYPAGTMGRVILTPAQADSISAYIQRWQQ